VLGIAAGSLAILVSINLSSIVIFYGIYLYAPGCIPCEWVSLRAPPLALPYDQPSRRAGCGGNP
jgi:hypothetical protein